MVSTSGGPNLSIAAACIMAMGAFLAPSAPTFFALPVPAFLALTGDRFFFLAVVVLGFLAALRLLLEAFAAFFCFFEALRRAFFFLVAIFTYSLFVRSA
jgi:hypothetical protein